MDPKATFIKYFGSTYQMERCGVLNEYRSYGVSKETEAQWSKEAFEKSLASVALKDDICKDFVCAKEFALRLKDEKLVKKLFAAFDLFALRKDYGKVLQSVGAVTDMLDMSRRREILSGVEHAAMTAQLLILLEAFLKSDESYKYFEENGGITILDNCIANLKSIGV